MLALVFVALLLPNSDFDIKIRQAISSKACCDNPDCTCKDCQGPGCKCLSAYKVHSMKHPSGRTVYVVSNKKNPLLSDSRNYLSKPVAQLEADRLNGKELKRNAPLRLVSPGRMMFRSSGGC